LAKYDYSLKRKDTN